MYDTFTCSLSQEGTETNLIEEVPKYLEDTRRTNYENGGVSVSGRLKNLQISVSQYSLKLKGGSISKYYLGDNIQTMTRGDTQRAVERVSDDLHVDLSEAVMTRLDVANNIMTRYPEENYYKYLGPSRNYTRHEQPNGVFYQNHQKAMIFYGKIKEQKDKGNLVPDWLNNRHMLRYEMRLMHRLRKQMNQVVLLSNIYEENFYIRVIDKYKEEYDQIQKKHTIMNTIKATSSVKDFGDQAIYFMVQALGINDSMSMLDEWQSMGKIERKAKSDLKRKVRYVLNNYSLDERNEIIDELDRKVQDVVKFYV